MRSVLLLISVIALAGAVQAQESSTAISAMEQANQAYSARDWSVAADAFAAITRTQPSNALAWLRLGISRHKLEQYAKAVEAFKHIEDDPQVGPSALYREAAATARLNKKDDAIALLNRAVDAGLAQPALFQQDVDLASLHDDAAFKRIMDKAESAAHPCAHQPVYRQFDFWLGEWDVVTTQGQNPAGTSSIQLIIDQCVLLENWTGGGGGTGKSFNHYDTTTKKWIQDWVDSRSNSVHFEGGLENGVMSYFADAVDGQGAHTRRHLQFFKLDADHIRQFSQMSNDGGTTWATEYDLTYIRKK